MKRKQTRHARRRIAQPTQYTIRGVSPALDRAVRRRARDEGVSLNAILISAIESLAAESPPRRDLSDVAGGPFDLASFEQVREAHEQLEPGLWR